MKTADGMLRGFVRKDWTVPLRIDTQTFGRQVGKVKAVLKTIDTTTARIDFVATGIPKVTAGMDTVAKSTTKAKSSLDSTTASIKKTTAASSGLESTLAKVGRRAASFAAGIIAYRVFSETTRAISGAIKSGVEFSTKLEDNLISLQHLLGGNKEDAQELQGALVKLADFTPFHFEDLEPLSAQLVAAKKAAGETNDEIKKELIPTLRTIGDASAALNRGAAGVSRLSLALAQSSAEGRITGRTLMSMQRVGVPALRYIGEAWGISTAKARDYVSKGMIPAREGQQAILEGMRRDFGGAMEKLSTTVSGKYSTLQDRFRSLAAKAIKPAYDELSKLLGEAVKFSSSHDAEKWADRTAVSVGQFIQKTKDAVAAIKDMGEALSMIDGAINPTGIVGRLFGVNTAQAAAWLSNNVSPLGIANSMFEQLARYGAQKRANTVVAPEMYRTGMTDPHGWTGTGMTDPHGWFPGITQQHKLLAGKGGGGTTTIAGVPSYYLAMEAHLGEQTSKVAGKMYQCGEAITFFMRKVGIASERASSVAAKMNIRPNAQGHFPVGTILHLGKGGPNTTRHYAIAGRINPDGTQMLLESTAPPSNMSASTYHIRGSRTVEQIRNRIIGAGLPNLKGTWRTEVELHNEEIRAAKAQERVAKKAETEAERRRRKKEQSDLEHQRVGYAELMKEYNKRVAEEERQAKLLAKMEKDRSEAIRDINLDIEKRSALIRYEQDLMGKVNVGEKERNDLLEIASQRIEKFVGFIRDIPEQDRQKFIGMGLDLVDFWAKQETGARKARRDFDNLQEAGKEWVKVLKEQDEAAAKFMDEWRALQIEADSNALKKLAKDLKAVADAEKKSQTAAEKFLVAWRRLQNKADLKEWKENLKGVVDSFEQVGKFYEKWLELQEKANARAREFAATMSAANAQIDAMSVPAGRRREDYLRFRELGRNRDEYGLSAEDRARIMAKEGILRDAQEVEDRLTRTAQAAASVIDSTFSNLNNGIRGMFDTLLDSTITTLQRIASEVVTNWAIKQLFGIALDAGGGYGLGRGRGTPSVGVLAGALGVPTGGINPGYTPGIADQLGIPQNVGSVGSIVPSGASVGGS